MKPVNKIGEEMAWQIPDGEEREMGLMHEGEVSGTKNIAAGSVRMLPGTKQTNLSVHKGEELYFVHKGKAKFYLSDDEYEVDEGSAVYIAPGTRHRAENIGDEDLILYWVNSPPVFGAAGGYKQIVKSWNQIR